MMDDGGDVVFESAGDDVNKLSKPIDDRRRLVTRAADICRCCGEEEVSGALTRNDSEHGIQATNKKIAKTKLFRNNDASGQLPWFCFFRDILFNILSR